MKRSMSLGQTEHALLYVRKPELNLKDRVQKIRFLSLTLRKMKKIHFRLNVSSITITRPWADEMSCMFHLKEAGVSTYNYFQEMMWMSGQVWKELKPGCRK